MFKVHCCLAAALATLATVLILSPLPARAQGDAQDIAAARQRIKANRELLLRYQHDLQLPRL